MKTNFLRCVFFLLALGLVSLVRAEDAGTVKARMEQRLSQVDALKEQGAIGENNRGLLEVRGGGGDSGAVVAAENKDREIVYSAVAQKTGSTAAQVGKARAAKIAQNSRPGVWLQDDAGNWKKK
jgi:uncharacterized protein YdbL (DUF1318 family)